MTKVIHTLVLLASFIVLATSCNKKTNTFIAAAGSPGEMLLVMDGDWLKGSEGESVKEMLQAEVPGLPQVEHWMRVQTVAEADFGDFLRNTRNILIVKANEDTYTHNSVKYSYNEWAQGQLLIVVQTPNADSLKALVANDGDKIRYLLLRHELFRYAEVWSSEFSSKADEYCQEVLGCHVNMPQDMLSYKKGKDFLWMSNNSDNKRSDMVVYSLPYRGKEDLSLEVMLARRDSVLGRNIPGATPDSKMTTIPEGLTHQYLQMPDGSYRGVLRGLWETTGTSAMAGPFIMHAIARPDEGKVYYIEGFVYYPNENKRDLVRRLEAALFSLRPLSEETFDPEPIKQIWWSDVH